MKQSEVVPLVCKEVAPRLYAEEMDYSFPYFAGMSAAKRLLLILNGP
jgi:hypothetical protein